MDRNRYNSKKIKRHKSGTGKGLRRVRLFVILIWLLICIVATLFIYRNYSLKHFSNTPVKTITLDGGVTTGNELKDDVPFGPND